MARTRSRLIVPKRSMVWIQMDIGPVNIVADASTQIASLSAGALLLRPFTVVRTRARLHVESDQGAASEIATGAFGMIVVSDQAVAAGSGSIPDPVASSNAPFFVWEPFINSFVFASGVGFEEPAGTDIVIDSKAQRKVGANEDVSMIVEETNTVGITVAITGRMLVKLH